MGWQILLPLLIQYGIPEAIKLWEKWQSNAPVTQTDIDELKALAAKTAKSQMTDALTRAGIALDDPKAVALLALLPK